MTQHTVTTFGDELELLAGEVARMGGLTERGLSGALDAVVRRDTELAESIITRDREIDEAQRELERQVTRLLALRQPLAQDLRLTIGALKIAGDLERIGDLAKNIAKRTLVLNQSEPLPLTRSIGRMGKLVTVLLTDVLDAYAKRDAALADSVWRRDEEVDEHYDSLFRELLTYMMEDVRRISTCTHLLFVAKNIERIGDHATNIAEVVHYLVTGEELDEERPKRDATLAAAADGDP